MALRNEGCSINHKTVQMLMSQIGLKAKRKKRHYHSYKGQIGKIAQNLINRDFSTERPNQKWTTDVSQVCIKDEKLYISPILNMYNYLALRSGMALSAQAVSKDTQRQQRLTKYVTQRQLLG